MSYTLDSVSESGSMSEMLSDVELKKVISFISWKNIPKNITLWAITL